MTHNNRHNDIANFISTNYDTLNKLPLKKIRKQVAEKMPLPKVPQKAFTKYVLYNLKQDKSFDFSHVENS